MSYKQYILVCGGTACDSIRGMELFNALKTAVKENGLINEVQVVRTGCLGFCEKGPIVKVLPQDTFYVEVKPEDAEEIIKEHIIKGREVSRLLYDKEQSKIHVAIEGIDFYQKQFRVVLRNCGAIDPNVIDEYIARDGYKALEKALFDMTPQDVIDEISKSGLRGRGGAGFPTGKKWSFAAAQPAGQKYMVCNADEGDPGAYMDRSTLEGDPHSVLEAMTIGGYAIGADKGFIYIRAEYPLAIKRLENALKQAREYGLLGNDILGSGFSFDIEIRLGAGAFVCGEETALLASIEGNRGMPRPRPPFPAVKGLWGRPTVINNVETLANIPVILLKGADWFNKIGTATSKGTKVFALTGKINNSGLIEVPMGTTLREIIFDIGGGIRGGKAFKAAQTGGPSGGIIPPQFLDTPIDYENLAKIGSIMGSGGLIVMDEDDCIPNIAKFYLDFTVDESCGKCAPCRIGGRKLLNYLDKICDGKGTHEDIENMREISEAMSRASLCGLGQTASNPVQSSLRYFMDEYKEHIDDKRCRAGKCKNLLRYTIDKTKCVGCTACARVCPANAIAGERKQPHAINNETCIKCGQCYEICKFHAITRE
ncbi:MAG: NADH-quinone oxidoreductase subunit NuoF [Kiritimatiellae bacterium]|jgi:NADP-reducing hydrogenase subunit HndC|nr:NADH-quinone oxidoreductase subunit NuoF [Kiritimatiellia bacterium]MDD3584209.1 NADH-quinone oxidoreductase subunit NuoF [Kiritimatiellia bacterium]HHU16580.1 NADH-quinone oxidoreductase subunit NuoF [Lentisphaerota bacterium]HON48104.1 NADH-quinone oxidoreductase subunit NuoF [Kiritimatiellia bacterium]